MHILVKSELHNIIEHECKIIEPLFEKFKWLSLLKCFVSMTRRKINQKLLLEFIEEFNEAVF